MLLLANIVRCTLQLRVHVVRHGPRRAPRGRQLPEALRTQDVRPVAPPAYSIPLLFADADPGTPLKMVASVPQPVVSVRAWPQNCTWSIIVRLHTCTCAACRCIRHEALEFLPFFPVSSFVPRVSTQCVAADAILRNGAHLLVPEAAKP